MKVILTHWLPFILYATLIFYVSSQEIPELPVPLQINYIDLVAHFLEYALFAWLAYRAFSSIRLLRPRRRRGTPYRPAERSGAGQNHILFVTLLISILYGFSDELHQYYVPGRQMDVYDFLFNAFGAIVIIIILYYRRGAEDAEKTKSHL